MKIPQMITAELRRLTSTPMAILALVALMCVPVLYGEKVADELVKRGDFD